MACVESDIKRVLAYSTVSQLGYMMAAAGRRRRGRGLLPPAHARRLQGAALPRRRRRHPRGRHQRHLPRWAASPARMPQTGHRVPRRHARARRRVAASRASSRRRRSWPACWAGGLTVPFVMLVLTAFLTAFYMFRVVFIAFFGPRGRAAGHGGTARRTPTTRRRSCACRSGSSRCSTVGIGIWFAVSHARGGVRGARLAHAARGRARGRRHRARVADVPARASLSADRLVARFAPIDFMAAPERYGLDALYARSTAGDPGRLSRLVGWIDRYLVDGLLNVLSAWTLRAGDRLRRIQTGQAQDYVYGVAFGVLLLIVWAQLAADRSWPPSRCSRSSRGRRSSARC